MHDFVDEGDQSGDGKMTFEEFAAFVMRSKEISLQTRTSPSTRTLRVGFAGHV